MAKPIATPSTVASHKAIIQQSIEFSSSSGDAIGDGFVQATKLDETTHANKIERLRKSCALVDNQKFDIAKCANHHKHTSYDDAGTKK